jgi:hypothetical protein
MIYTEEGRDRLDDPLATNFKCRRKSTLENRCQFLIPLNGELEEYKLIGMKKVKSITAVQFGHIFLPLRGKSTKTFIGMNRMCCMA